MSCYVREYLEDYDDVAEADVAHLAELDRSCHLRGSRRGAALPTDYESASTAPAADQAACVPVLDGWCALGILAGFWSTDANRRRVQPVDL